MFQVALACVLTVVVAANPQFDKLLVLHRHGARGPMGVSNGTLICDFPYCQLTNNGKNMCRSLGRYVSTTYNVTGRLTLPLHYNVSFMSSQSTDYSRVVVSGEAMVMGLFEKSPLPALPFVDFVPRTADLSLCMWESWPSWKIRGTYDAELHVDDAWVREFIGADHLAALGTYFGLSTMCADAPTDCVGFVQDSIACNVSAGVEVPSWMLDKWDDYRTVVSKFLARILGYNPSVAYNEQIGSLGYPFVTSAMQYFATDTGLQQLAHYAAHDWTLLAVYSALGMWFSATDAGNTTFVPRFTETLMLEQWIGDDQQRYIRGLWGYPNQAPTNSTSYDFDFRPANLTCIYANGTQYTSLSLSDSWCLADDLWRFINSTAPASPLGVCYASDNSLSNQGCDQDAAPPAGSRCAFYRQNCPDATCGQTTGAFAEPSSGYRCVSPTTASDTPFLAATLVALVAPAVLGGAIGGFYFTNRIRSIFWSFRKTDERDPLPQQE